MTDKEKFLEISAWINSWSHSLETKPMHLGRTFTELESFLYPFDIIDHILRYSEPWEEQLSWSCFCSFKGWIEGAQYFPEEVFKSSDKDPFFLFKKYRKEYREWVEMKIEHRNNPSESRLTDLLRQANDIEVNMLVQWFSEYPSRAALEIYRNRINRKYVSNPNIAIGLAKMGDEKVFVWAKNNVMTAKSYNARKVALNCIASSPLDEADIILQKIICAGNFQDLECIIFALEYSKNINKLDRLKQIKPIISGNEFLCNRLENVLNKLKAGPLRPSMLKGARARRNPEGT